MNLFLVHLRTPLLIATIIYSLPAHSADIVNENDPVPPEASIVAEQKSNGWYIAARIGAAFAQDTNLISGGASVRSSHGSGYAFAGAFGYTFPSNSPLSFRTELELGYLALGLFRPTTTTSSAKAVTGLANAYVDYELGFISPYASVGIGYGAITSSTPSPTPTGLILNANQGGLAWQFGLGAAYSLSDTVKLDFGYRYLGIEKLKYDAGGPTPLNGNLRTHQIRLGIRKAF